MTAAALLAVAAGGAFGAVGRFLVTVAVNEATRGAPWGTFTVNIVGSLLLGAAVVLLPTRTTSPELRYLITVGFMGSFTTFSTYSFETLEMMREGLWLRAGGYALGSLALGVAAVALGMAAAGALTRG